MGTFVTKLKALAHDKRGITAREYRLTAGIVALAVIGSATALSAKLSGAITAALGALR